MELIAAIILGFVVGSVMGWMISRGKQQALVTKIEMLQTQADAQTAALQRQLDEWKASAHEQMETQKQEAEKRRQEALQEKEKACREALDAKDAACREMLAGQERRHAEAMEAQQARFEEMMAKVSAQVKSATDDMLKQRQKEFAEASHTNLGQIVNPLRETIDKMKQAMSENTLKQTSMSSEMKANIEHMMRQSAAAQKSAEELTRVFKHGTKVQGDWGETVLDELLEAQGLTRGIHYDVQSVIRDGNGEVVKSEEGGLMRPDVILHLDQRREVIIDSKVSLTAFIDYVNAETEDQRQQYLKAHIESLQKHVKELSVKDYSSYIRPPKVKMDYVIMFVPHTGALWTALNAQPDLWRKAMDKNVFIADEQTLFAALRIINLTWTQITQVQNHEKVYALANEMLDRVGQFMKKYQALGKALDNAKSAYEDGEKKLQPSGQSILQTCNKLVKLGAKQSDRNPLPQLMDVDDVPALGDAKEL
ncbi:DNA recombination protein RmuC [Bacteroides gallinaceum]|uniref:DNA recombination protein RmuC n=1 Tax=Bacteroides gallinaceum TaxID=1462571 RepID=UPI0019570063|nr:DNA recombination protein RmuC [Bacteroides gallinaceum]MBM6657837.1 DNA recombination protein RmuC [Bacteroides gallinaceum]